MNPHQVTKDFESELCNYTGAPFAVAVTSCTMALLLAVAWHLRPPRIRAAHAGDLIRLAAAPLPGGINWVDQDHAVDTTPARVEIPKRTYVSVPQSIIHAGGRPTFRDEEWIGAYQLKPLPVWDSARLFTSGMYRDFGRTFSHGAEHYVDVPGSGQFVCLSFHASKILADTQGGAILHDNAEADAWFRRARFDGRTEGVAPKDDRFDMLGWHAYLSADIAARLLWKLSVLPKHNEPLPNDDYPDLSTFEIFK